MRENKALIKEFKMKQQLRKPRKLKNRILPQKSKTKFKCRVISNPDELMNMGYTTSKQINSLNDNEFMKKVGSTPSKKVSSVNDYELLKIVC